MKCVESKKPVRNPLFQGVQISATPKTNRTRDVFSRPQQQQPHQKQREPELEAITASSAPRIPQSSLPRARNPLLSSIQATPTRRSLPRPSRAMDREPVFPPSSPIHIRRSSAQLFSSVPDSAVKAVPTSWTTHGGIQETPVKKRAVSTVFDHGHPVSSPNFDQENTKQVEVKESDDVPPIGTTRTQQGESIYKSLGWDDDSDDLA